MNAIRPISSAPELLKRYKGDRAGLVKYYKDNFELIYRDKYFLVDAELKVLGIESNRKLVTLEKLIELLEDQKRVETAKRLLLRYTENSFATVAQWREWLEENRGRIYFSDVGGYRFRVIPKGYLELPRTAK